MKSNELEKFISELLLAFHEKRLKSIASLRLEKILKRKNPYLYKAKNILTAEELIKAILDAHLSSQEETIFGELLEQLAIFICKKFREGRKSSAPGIDLEFENDGIHYIIAIKSGPNWGNSQQIARLKENFKKAVLTLRTNNPRINIRAINGCCYGKGNGKEGMDYTKLCGQRFWSFISGNENLYIDIIKPLEKVAKEKEEGFKEAYSNVINRFTREILEKFYSKSGAIDWEKLVKFNSGI